MSIEHFSGISPQTRIQMAGEMKESGLEWQTQKFAAAGKIFKYAALKDHSTLLQKFTRRVGVLFSPKSRRQLAFRKQMRLQQKQGFLQQLKKTHGEVGLHLFLRTCKADKSFAKIANPQRRQETINKGAWVDFSKLLALTSALHMEAPKSYSYEPTPGPPAPTPAQSKPTPLTPEENAAKEHLEKSLADM